MLELELVLHEAAVEKKSSTIDVDLDEWRTEGHEYIDKRIRRPIKGAFGRIVTYSEARIVGWLPAEESDYTNQAGEAAALWHLDQGWCFRSLPPSNLICSYIHPHTIKLNLGEPTGHGAAGPAPAPLQVVRCIWDEPGA